MSGTATMDQVASVITLAQNDPAFRSQLIASPAAALESQGISVPSGTSLQTLENSGTVANLVIPAMPSLSGDAATEVTSLASSNATPNSALDAYAKLVIDSWQSSSLRQQLLSNPAAVLTERGITVPAGLTIQALESSDTNAYAVAPASSADGMATSVVANFSNLSTLITGGSYLAGLVFSLSSIMEFKTHKDNPTQIPVGTPVALVFIAAALLFIPSILSTSGTTEA